MAGASSSGCVHLYADRIPGMQWAGDLATRLLADFAAASREAARPEVREFAERVDVSEIYRAVEAFRASVGSLPDQNDGAKFQEYLARVRDAAQAVRGAKAKRTADAGQAKAQGYLARDRERNRALNGHQRCRARPLN